MDRRGSGRQLEQPVDELILFPNISGIDPACLPLANHGHRLVARDRPLGGVERTKASLGLHRSLNRAMVLFEDIVQILDRSMVAAAVRNSFFFHAGNRRALETALIGVDDAALRLREIAERNDETGVGLQLHRATPTTGNRWWHSWNRRPDRGNTSGRSREYRSHQHARIC
jgi:hypothetical protein